jgi:hypothetical protein
MASFGVGSEQLSAEVDVDDKIMASSSTVVIRHQTPYQIFRSNRSSTTKTTTTSKADAGDHFINNDKKVEVEEEEEESYIESDVEGEGEEDDGSDDKENVIPNATASLLSPNSIEIRQAARLLLMRQPSQRRVDRTQQQRRQHHPPSKDAQRRTMSSSGRAALQPLSSIANGGNIIEKRGVNKKCNDLDAFDKIQKEAHDIKEELAADLDEIRDAAKNIASILVSPINRAVEAGGGAIDGAFDALTTGVDALSTGAWSVIGQFWDEVASEGARGEVTDK